MSTLKVSRMEHEDDARLVQVCIHMPHIFYSFLIIFVLSKREFFICLPIKKCSLGPSHFFTT